MKRLLFLLWLALFAAGAVGVSQRLLTGHEATAYKSYIPWGLWVAVYIYLVGLSAGAFLLSTLVYVFRIERFEPIGRMALLTVLATLVGALLIIWLDLGHMGRFWRFYTQPNFLSMMAWMVWFYTAYFVLLVVELWFSLRADMAARAASGGAWAGWSNFLCFGRRDVRPESAMRDAKVLRVLGGVGVALAIAFSGGVGALFGVIGARPFWHSGLYPILFLVSALASGAALLTVTVVLVWPDKAAPAYRRLVVDLGRMTLAFLALDVLLEWAEATIALWGSIPAHVDAYKVLLFGDFWWVFWIVHVLLGVVVPAAILLLWPRRVPAVGTAAFLIATTFLSVRLNIVIPGLAVPELKALESAFRDSRLGFEYFPSAMEWLVTLFVVAVGIAVFYLGLRMLPIIGANVREV